MFALLIAVWCVVGGTAFGAMMIAGAMLYTGKWTLPGTNMREIQHAKVRKEIATLRAETAQQDFFREQIEGNRDVFRIETTTRMEAASDASFQRALESGPTQESAGSNNV